MKVLAEKAVTSSDYTIHILMLDMSKAFDTVDRKTLFTDLEEILDYDELHMLKLLVENVELTVRVGKSYSSETIKTTIGVPQGDCLSPVLFILYLSQALKVKRNTNPTSLDHTYAAPSYELALIDHTYAKPPKVNMTVEPKYADDISWVTNDTSEVERLQKAIPPKLTARNLKVNESKTEHHVISRNHDEEWKKCKYLGSIIDTEKDMERRKALALNIYNEKKKLIENKKTNVHTKMRIINAYVTPIYMYNSELWTLTKKRENEIDVTQRKILRKALCIHWPKKISNKKLYNITKQKAWSKIIRERRLKWTGHLLRLDPETPAKLALHEAARKIKRPKGRPKKTWTKQMEEDIKWLNIELNGGGGKYSGEGTLTSENIEQLEQIASNRQEWQSLVKRAMSQPSTPDGVGDAQRH